MDFAQTTLFAGVAVAVIVAARWWRRPWVFPVVMVILAVSVLAFAASAQATTKIAGGPASVANHRWCSWFRVKKQRYGVIDAKLWELREKVTWCHNRSKTKVNWIERTWGHWAIGGTWKFASAKRSGSRANDRSWYSRRVSAIFDGYTPLGLFDETNTPFVKIKVYATGRVSYNTGCGC